MHEVQIYLGLSGRRRRHPEERLPSLLETNAAGRLGTLLQLISEVV
jgi:hypothetical protein